MKKLLFASAIALMSSSFAHIDKDSFSYVARLENLSSMEKDWLSIEEVNAFKDSKFYDKEGKEISFDEWKSLWNDKNYKTLAKYEKQGILIQALWVGVDLLSEKAIFCSQIYCPSMDIEIETRKHIAQEDALNSFETMVRKYVR